MITLSPTDFLSGLAGTASVITYTVVGDAIVSGNDSFKVLAQGQLGNTVGTIIAATSGQQSLIKNIFLNNTSASNVSITLYINGTTSANQIVKLSIPAYGSAAYTSSEAWIVYDGSGNIQSGIVGPTGAQGTTGTAGLTGAQGLTGATGATGPTQVFYGIATLNFGTAPGSNTASVTVTGQSSLLTTSTISVYMMGDVTSDHNAFEHELVPIKLTATNLINNTGFTIVGLADWRLTGAFTVRWQWNN